MEHSFRLEPFSHSIGLRPRNRELISEQEQERREELEEIDRENAVKEAVSAIEQDLQNRIHAGYSLEQILEDVERAVCQLTELDGVQRIRSWIVDEAARKIERFAEVSDRSGRVDLRQAVASLRGLYEITGRNLVPRILQDDSHGYGALVAVEFPAMAYFALEMAECSTGEKAEWDDILSRASSVSRVELLQRAFGGTDRLRPEDIEEIASRYLPVWSPEGDSWEESIRLPDVREARRALTVSRALNVPLPKNSEIAAPISVHFSARNFYIDFRWVPADRRGSVLRENALVLIKLAQECGLSVDWQRFVETVSGSGGFEPSTYEDKLAFIKDVRTAFGVERIDVRIRDILPNWLRYDVLPAKDETTELLKRMAWALGNGWTPGTPWPSLSDAQAAFVGLFDVLNEWQADVDAERAFSEMAEAFGRPISFDPERMESEFRRIGWMTDNEQALEAGGSTEFWNSIGTNIDNRFYHADWFLEDLARRVRTATLLSGCRPIRWPVERVPLPPTDKIIACLAASSKIGAREFALVVNLLLPDARAAIEAAASERLYSHPHAEVETVFRVAKTLDIPLVLSGEHVAYRIVSQEGKSEITNWIALWGAYGVGELPLRPVEKAHLLHALLKTNGTYVGDEYPRVLESLVCPDGSKELDDQRAFIMRFGFSGSGDPLTAWKHAVRIFHVRPTVLTDREFCVILQRNQLDESVEVFGCTLVAEQLARCFTESTGELRGIVVNHRGLLETIEREAKKTRGNEIDAVGAVRALLRIVRAQAPSENLDNDPWTQTFQELVRAVAPRTREAFDGLASFVETYGIVGSPELANLHIAILSARSFSDVAPKHRRALADLGIRVSPDDRPDAWPYPSPKSLVRELEKWVNHLAESLLADRVPEGVESALGEGLFKSFLGETKWGNDDSHVRLLDTWRQTVQKRPDAGRVPDAYRRVSFSVPAFERVVSVADDLDARRDAILRSFETIERYAPLASSLQAALRPNAHAYWVERAAALREPAAAKLDAQISDERFVLESSDEIFHAAMEIETDEKRRKKLSARRRAISVEGGAGKGRTGTAGTRLAPHALR